MRIPCPVGLWDVSNVRPVFNDNLYSPQQKSLIRAHYEPLTGECVRDVCTKCVHKGRASGSVCESDSSGRSKEVGSYPHLCQTRRISCCSGCPSSCFLCRISLSFYLFVGGKRLNFNRMGTVCVFPSQNKHSLSSPYSEKEG